MKPDFIDTCLSFSEIEQRFLSIASSCYADSFLGHLKFCFLGKRVNVIKRDGKILVWERNMWTGILYSVIYLNTTEIGPRKGVEYFLRVNLLARYFIIFSCLTVFIGFILSGFSIIISLILVFPYSLLLLLISRHARREARNFLKEISKD
jgi:hypothetical protein